jgi:hypothetical protein
MLWLFCKLPRGKFAGTFGPPGTFRTRCPRRKSLPPGLCFPSLGLARFALFLGLAEAVAIANPNLSLLPLARPGLFGLELA